MLLHRLSSFILLCVISAILLITAHGSQANDLTALQKHVSFFDRNGDGVITIKETYKGLRAIGLGYAAAAASSLFINGALSSATLPQGKKSSLSLPVYVENISKGKHTSDTGVFDSQGRFVPEKFEEIFTKYAKTKPNALTSEEVDNMREGIAKPGDTKGQTGSKAEWTLLYNLGKDNDGFLEKDTVRCVYDGSLFYKLEQGRSSSAKKS